MRVNKFICYWVIKQRYPGAWEDVFAAETWKETKQALKDYRENMPFYPVKAVRVREINPSWKGQ